MDLQSKKRELTALAREQGGYFLARQAEALGFDNANQHLRVKSGEWQRVRRGIYRLAAEPEARHEDLHVLSLYLKRRDGGDGAVFGLETAAMLHGMGDFMPSKVHALVDQGFRRRSELPPVLELTRVDDLEAGVQYAMGLPVTTPLRTISDLIAVGDRDLEEVRRTFLAARRDGLITRRGLETGAGVSAAAREKMLRWAEEAEER